MKFLERHFWILCIATTLAGLLYPPVGYPFRNVALFLMGILFVSGLKLDFAAALREFRRPGLLLYVCAMFLVVLPGVAYLAARAVLDEQFAVGVLILVCMPAGVVTSSLTDITGGNAALALVVTLATSLLCPLVAPPLINAVTGELAHGGAQLLARQAIYLAGILFAPLTAAFFVRRHWPNLVNRHRDALTGLSILLLGAVILGAMSLAGDQCMAWVRRSPAEAVKLVGFLFGLSAMLHVAGYWIAPWRPRPDRGALSINAAYVNNALGIVFANAFFASNPKFALAAIPSVLLEIPMTLAILPVRWHLSRHRLRLVPAEQDIEAT